MKNLVRNSQAVLEEIKEECAYINAPVVLMDNNCQISRYLSNDTKHIAKVEELLDGLNYGFEDMVIPYGQDYVTKEEKERINKLCDNARKELTSMGYMVIERKSSLEWPPYTIAIK